MTLVNVVDVLRQLPGLHKCCKQHCERCGVGRVIEPWYYDEGHDLVRIVVACPGCSRICCDDQGVTLRQSRKLFGWKDGVMYVMGDEYQKVYEAMDDKVRPLFEQMPNEAQFRYIESWLARPDTHGSHRDMLPAFLAGWDAGQNDLLRRFNVRAQSALSDFVASLFEDRPKRRRKSA